MSFESLLPTSNFAFCHVSPSSRQGINFEDIMFEMINLNCFKFDLMNFKNLLESKFIFFKLYYLAPFAKFMFEFMAHYGLRINLKEKLIDDQLLDSLINDCLPYTLIQVPSLFVGLTFFINLKHNISSYPLLFTGFCDFLSP